MYLVYYYIIRVKPSMFLEYNAFDWQMRYFSYSFSLILKNMDMLFPYNTHSTTINRFTAEVNSKLLGAFLMVQIGRTFLLALKLFANVANRIRILVSLNSCLDRKSSDIGLGGMPREYIQTDCATNKVRT